MPFEVKDVAGLSQPMTKLADLVSAGIGTLYRPKAIRDQAEAKAYEIKALSKAQAEADEERKDIELAAAVKRVTTLFGNRPELVERAKQRLLTREIEGQINIEAIADHAAEALPSQVTDQPVSPDWRRKFFQEAENVCEADMQLLWGKVLAGELTTPGTYSLRTLNTLSQLSRNEAEHFRVACSLAMADGWIAITGQRISLSLGPFGLSYDAILQLRDAGLVLDGDQIHKEFRQSSSAPSSAATQFHLVNNRVLIEISGPSLPSLRINALVFTSAGRELQRLIDNNPNPDYLKALGIHLRQHGLSAKRGTPVQQSEGIAVITFEEDL